MAGGSPLTPNLSLAPRPEPCPQGMPDVAQGFWQRGCPRGAPLPAPPRARARSRCS